MAEQTMMMKVLSQIFLGLRMAIYVGAIPLGAWVNGTLDVETGVLCTNVYDLLDIASGGTIAGITFLSGRVAKRNGGAT